MSGSMAESAGMSPEQFRKMICDKVQETTSDYLDKHLDKHLDLGADVGLATQVSGKQSSLNTIVVLMPTGTVNTLNANILYWGDIVPYGPSTSSANYYGALIGPTSAISAPSATATTSPVVIPVSTITASGFGWQAPEWLNAPSGVSGQTQISNGQTYQLSLLFMQQNLASFENLNVNSSEQATQAPILTSTNLSMIRNNPWGFTSTNALPISNAITAEQYRQNQIVAQLDATVSLFDYVQLTTGVTAGTNSVTFSCIFNALVKESRGVSFAAKVAKAQRARPALPAPRR